MQITYCSTYREMSNISAGRVMDEIVKKPDLLLCAATGSSPEGLYKKLAHIAGRERQLFKKLRILKLDEWGGVPVNHLVTCEYFIRNRVLGPLSIPMEHYISFDSHPEEPEIECARIRSMVDKEGPIDICILGLGRNGHLALNEPAEKLEPFCHVAKLSEESLQHPMIADLESKPEYGLTLGMKEILSSRKIIMLVSGKEKKQVAEKFLKGKVSTDLPASFLWLHPHVECFVDQEIME